MLYYSGLNQQLSGVSGRLGGGSAALLLPARWQDEQGWNGNLPDFTITHVLHDVPISLPGLFRLLAAQANAAASGPRRLPGPLGGRVLSVLLPMPHLPAMSASQRSSCPLRGR